jgi:hypothetical protein
VKNEPGTKKFFDLIRPPFKAVLSNGFIIDQDGKTVGRIPALFSTHFEGEMTDEMHCWIVDAMNEKWEREKPPDPEEPVYCSSCKHLEEWQQGYYRCQARDCSVDPRVFEPCEVYEKD